MGWGGREGGVGLRGKGEAGPPPSGRSYPEKVLSSCRYSSLRSNSGSGPPLSKASALLKVESESESHTVFRLGGKMNKESFKGKRFGQWKVRSARDGVVTNPH